MFDIGFGELLLVVIIGLIVLGPERLPTAVRAVSAWIRTLRALSASVKSDLSRELNLQELQESVQKVKNTRLEDLSPELHATLNELKEMRTEAQLPSDEQKKENAAVAQVLYEDEALLDAEQYKNRPIRPATPVELTQKVPFEGREDIKTLLRGNSENEPVLSTAPLSETAHNDRSVNAVNHHDSTRPTTINQPSD